MYSLKILISNIMDVFKIVGLLNGSNLSTKRELSEKYLFNQRILPERVRNISQVFTDWQK